LKNVEDETQVTMRDAKTFALKVNWKKRKLLHGEDMQKKIVDSRTKNLLHVEDMQKKDVDSRTKKLLHVLIAPMKKKCVLENVEDETQMIMRDAKTVALEIMEDKRKLLAEVGKMENACLTVAT